ncbi:phosphotransferase family protein [Halalkalibaculum sp. DA384]|uniref:phosphotransferase family protein n=1 Tax=Halalkalibaculum sp. DA384 TaxID=3373606 RepID=UPI00375413E6
MNREKIVYLLKDQGLLSGSSVELKPLEGGVSSDIYLATDGRHKYVIKQALQKLQVEDDWYADISRNDIEQDFIRYLGKYRPGAIPKLIYNNKEEHFYVMEFLGKDFRNWKQEMLGGVFNRDTAVKAARLLADIHLHSQDDDDLRQQFNNLENFHSLRIEPYLITTGRRHPRLQSHFDEEAERLQQHRQALVHGDFSPKNIMVKGDRVVILDHEVAWYGDPAFDAAFFLNHLYLKMLYHYTRQGEIVDLATAAWDTYFSQLDKPLREGLEKRVGRLLLMMMLARVDGKSPVEYLEERQQKFIRDFVHHQLPGRVLFLSDINENWKSKMENTNI